MTELKTADKVYTNLTHFKEWLPWTQWAHKEKAQIYLLYNTLPPNLQKKLLKVEWTQNCTANHVVKGSLPGGLDSDLAPRSPQDGGELKQGPKEQLSTWYEKTQEVIEDAFGPNKYIWTLVQRRLVASVFIKGARYKQANCFRPRRPSLPLQECLQQK